jgi:hypothetical protein
MVTRCLNCNGILTKSDSVCYSCGDPAPKWAKKSTIPKRYPKRHSLVSNLTFLASLALTGYSLLAPEKPPLTVSLAASGFLLLVKLIVDWTARTRAERQKT